MNRRAPYSVEPNSRCLMPRLSDRRFVRLSEYRGLYPTGLIPYTRQRAIINHGPTTEGSCLFSFISYYRFSYSLSVSSHILLYAPLSTKPNKDLGMVWRLPHLGQGMGWEYTVACHSMSRASKTWPQSSHLNLFFPLIIVVNVSKLDMLCKDRLFIINVQGKRRKKSSFP